MDVVNVVLFYLEIISDATNELLPGDNKRVTQLNSSQSACISCNVERSNICSSDLNKNHKEREGGGGGGGQVCQKSLEQTSDLYELKQTATKKNNG